VLSQFAQACCSIADTTADETGFVPVRNLLRRFQASLIARPLLVEGMIASQRRDINSEDRHWLVLVDSEKYSFKDHDIECEGPQQSLPERLRFTIAHELAHSLAFRVSEFGIKLLHTDTAQSAHALVSAIEKETDRLSSLLLVSQQALKVLLRGRGAPPSAIEFAHARRAMAISRPVLISRLRSLPLHDPEGLRNGYGLTNMAIGMAEWIEGGRAILRNWPIYAHFDRNVLPEFLLQLANQDRLPASLAFQDNSFSLCGGSVDVVPLNVAGSTLSWLAQAPLIQMLKNGKSRKPYPLDWSEQNLLFGELTAHLKEPALFKVNTGMREKEVCQLRWEWEQRVPELDTPEIKRTVFVLPEWLTKNQEERVVVLNDVAQGIVDRLRGGHPTYVFTWVNRKANGDRLPV
jgi:hypothetical protein